MRIIAKLVGLTALAFLVLLANPARAGDIMGVVVRDAAGQVSTHGQPSSVEQCAAFIELFLDRRASGVELLLTLGDPEFTGVVIAPFCIHADGTAAGPEGLMLDLGL